MWKMQLVAKLPDIQIQFDEIMAPYVSFKVGGPADCLVSVTNEEEVRQVLFATSELKIPLMILGKGSNLLVVDEGIEGAVLMFKGSLLEGQKVSEDRIYCGAGMDLGDVSRLAESFELTGLEFAVGIPGSLGGAVFMNAGAYDGEIAGVIESVRWMDSHGTIHNLSKEECQFSYRSSFFQKNGGIILGVTMSLKKGNNEQINARMTELTAQRESKQPLEWASAGSTFKRPPGYFAGTLIQDAGLKGFTYGDAQVSEKHAGFVINCGQATANDVLMLIKTVREKVYEYADVWLCPEVRIVGRTAEKWQYFYK